MELLFWISVFIVLYTFMGYGLIITLLAKVKGKENNPLAVDELPEITLLIAAYNEEEIIKEKIENTLALQYPKNKLNIAFVTDGSNDATVDTENDAAVCV